VFEIDPETRERIITWLFRVGFALLVVLILLVLLHS
jgi:hypothetical protein